MRHGLGFHNRHSAGGFQPISLFTGGVQGAWYDPSDFGASGTDGVGTLFQDSAGTTPVTAVEQAVGLMLDKSKGLVLGPELVTNGDFSSGLTGWTNVSTGTGTATVSGGALVLVGTDASNRGQARQSVSTTVGAWYRLVVTTTNTGGNTTIKVGTTAGAQNIVAVGIQSTNNYTNYFVAQTTTTWLEFATGGAATCTVDNVSVREAPGNHAYQTTSASRPTLRARYNLLTYSEEFDNAAWNSIAAGATVTPNTNVAPDGTLTADTIAFTSGGYRYQQATSPSISAGQSVTYSAWVWSASKAKIVLRVYDAGATDIGMQSVSLTTTPQRISITLVATATRTQWFVGFDNRTIVGGDGIAGDVIVWGAQLVPTAVFPSNTYQRIAAATDYATGAAFPPYLFFDGTDDSMLTNSVDFSATDKMTVWAGVTKSAEASYPTLVELSAAIGTNNGSFAIYTSGSSAPRYPVYLQGTTQAGYEPQTYAAPITNVLAFLLDIGAPDRSTEVVPRINGVLNQTNPVASGTAGTGNFGNYPLFIGSRNNSSNRLVGNIYSLIIAGQSYSSGQISSTESWVAAKTPLGTI